MYPWEGWELVSLRRGKRNIEKSKVVSSNHASLYDSDFSVVVAKQPLGFFFSFIHVATPTKILFPIDPIIGHFRVHVCLLFKASLSAKFL